MLAVKRTAPKAAVGSAQRRKDGDKEGEEGGEAAPPPDERTWLQRNWIYLIPMVFMVCCMTPTILYNKIHSQLIMTGEGIMCCIHLRKLQTQ